MEFSGVNYSWYEVVQVHSIPNAQIVGYENLMDYEVWSDLSSYC